MRRAGRGGPYARGNRPGGRVTGVKADPVRPSRYGGWRTSVLWSARQAVATFLAHPDQWRLLADRPELAANAAEEVVRYCPSALLGVPRIAKTEVTLHDKVFPAGICLLPVTGSANRDGAVFARAGTFDIGRERTTQLTFGGGIHYCLGAALARVELQEALPRLAAGLRGLTAVGEAEWLSPTEAVYGSVRLPVTVPG